MNKKDFKPKNKGITLIALVITIIVMLILVIVTINVAINGGLFRYAKIAKEGTIGSQEKDHLQAAYFTAKIGALGGEVSERDLQNALDAEVGEGKTAVSKNGSTLEVLFYDTYTKYSIDGDSLIGSKLTELHITNHDELLAFATSVNNGENYRDYIVYLDADITMPDEDWVVIGTPGTHDEPGVSFMGIFEGNNHTISNLTLTQSHRYTGLFCVNNGTIQNLKVKSNISCGATATGAIAGKNIKRIVNCAAEVTINSSLAGSGITVAIGGITGFNHRYNRKLQSIWDNICIR